MPRRNTTEFDELMRTLYRVRELKDPDPRILRAIEKRLKEIACDPYDANPRTKPKAPKNFALKLAEPKPQT